MKSWLLCSLLVYLSCTSGLWARAFQDLGFESAALVPVPSNPYNAVYLDTALPGWSGSSGANQLDWVLYNDAFLDSTGIALWSSSGAFPVIQGNYTVSLEAGVQLGSSSISADASLSQTGLVPVGTKSLSFLAYSFGPFTVSLGGTNLNLISFPVPNQNYSLYEADTSAFTGQTAELQFTVFAQNPYNSQLHGLTLDSIQFSPDAIPELGTLNLLVIGILSLAFWHRARRKTA